MMIKIMIVVAFIGIGMLIVGWFHNHNLIMDRLDVFVQKSNQFTTKDGQYLCKRIADLERYSIGFKKAGKHYLPCNYIKE